MRGTLLASGTVFSNRELLPLGLCLGHPFNNLTPIQSPEGASGAQVLKHQKVMMLLGFESRL